MQVDRATYEQNWERAFGRPSEWLDEANERMRERMREHMTSKPEIDPKDTDVQD
jgi:hypothetical protein